MIYAEIASRLAPLGMMTFGAFHPGPDAAVPGDPGTLVLVGNAGPAMWRAFAAARPAGADPLDAWTRQELCALAHDLGASTLFPFGGPPYLPFQRWAQAAGPVRPSPLGILIHPDYGLWHAYRGALAFADRLDLPAADARPVPCDTCRARPCLTACPVDAFSLPAGYDVAACADHLTSPAGGNCNDFGCRARHACPVGREFAYAPEQAAFHMAAFRRA